MLMAHVAQLKEGILRALELYIDTSIELGRYGKIIGVLKTVILEYPFHENFYAKLMIVLQHNGRRCEALDVYQQLRNTLVSELGIEPSGELRDLQRALLAGEAVVLAAPVSSYQGNLTRPAQLPPDIADFVGRDEQLSHIESEVTHEGAVVRLVSITGTPGVGKTVLATHVAHRIRSHFSRRAVLRHPAWSEDVPADPFVILGGCLRAIGLRDEQIPDSLVERTQLFRSWSAERKVLVVLDDAASAARRSRCCRAALAAACWSRAARYSPGWRVPA